MKQLNCCNRRRINKMADELKKKLLFKNPALQKQTVWQVHSAVLEKRKAVNGQLFTGHSNEPPELGVLWDSCGSGSPVVSTTSAECLVKLVLQKYADFNYVMRKMLNTVPVSKNVCAVVQAITDLLLLEVHWSEESIEEYICPYNLRTPPHPYISVLTSSPGTSPLLMEQVRQLLDMENLRFCDPCGVMRMLEPFLKFVLLAPNGNNTDLHVALQLHSELLLAAGEQIGGNSARSRKFADCITSFLVSLVPYYQVEKQTLGHTVFLVNQLTHWLIQQYQLELRSENWDVHMSTMVCHLVSLGWDQLSNGHDMMSTLTLLSKIHKATHEVFLDPTIIAALSVLLLQSPARYQGNILELCLSILRSTEHVEDTPSSIPVQTAGCLLLLPILQILATPGTETWTAASGRTTCQQLASQVLAILELITTREVYQEKQEEEAQCGLLLDAPLSSWMRVVRTSAVMMQRCTWNKMSAVNWLKSLQSTLPSQSEVSCHVTMLLSALLVTSCDGVAMEIPRVIGLVSKIDPSQGPTLLPLLLYKLGKENTPDLRLEVLYTLPGLATHRVTVGPVLRTIQTVGLSPQLRPLAIRLLCKLWHVQSRVFPHLQRMLVAADADVTGKETLQELHIAKAATIRDICITRPTQHGADLLALLSKILTENTKPGAIVNDPSSIVVTLAMEGLQSLCQHEVVDLCTAWKVLSTKLIADERPQVMASVCRLFGLVPQLATESEEYEVFKEEALSFLWGCTQNKNSRVAGPAYSSLSHFGPEDLKIKYLPPEIRDPLKEKLLSKRKSAQSETESEEDEEEKEKAVANTLCPGNALVQLLQRTDDRVLPDFQKLLTSVLRHEVSSLPRGLAYSVTRGNSQCTQAVDGVPAFLLTQYEKSKTPGVNQGLAAGLLFSYQPPVEHRQDKPQRRHILGYARSYRSMLDTLLHEVPVQPSEWHRNMLAPQAWTSFMNRVYSKCLEGRIAELEMQHKRGHIKETEELERKRKSAWLWVRDELTNQLKSASKGNPSVQANSVLGLAGLASTMASYMAQQTDSESRRETDSEGSPGSDGASQEQQYQGSREWLVIVADTLIVILDGNYKAKGPTLQWCQQVSSSKSTASSLLARACAALSLSQLVPVLVMLDVDRIKAVVGLLREKLPGQPKAGSSAVIQVHCSLGLGLVLSKLYEEHFSDLAGKEGYLLMSTALDVLENVALSSELENTEGAILGVGAALVSLCKEGLVDSRVHATAMHHKLRALLVEHEKDPGLKLQYLCMGVCCLTVSAFHAGLISVDIASECVVTVHQLLQGHQQISGVSLPFGLLLHGLARSGHPGVPELASHQANVWKNCLTDQNAPTLQRLAAVNGLLALFGSEQRFFQVDSDDSEIDVVKENLADVVKVSLKIVSGAEDIGVATNVAWLLGHLHDALSSNPVTRTSVPPSYSYLPDSSTLRAVFDSLVLAGKTGPQSGQNCATVNVTLESLISGPKTALPPVNWASVLGPLMRSAFGEKTSQLCLRFAVTQAKSSSSLASFLSSWLSAGAFSGLQEAGKREIFRRLPRLVTSVPVARVQEFLEGAAVNAFTCDREEALCAADLVIGLSSVLQLSDPPPSVFACACSTVGSLYRVACGRTSKLNTELHSLSQCLVHLPPDRLQKLLEEAQISPSVGTEVISVLVSEGDLPTKWLNTCLDHMLKDAKLSKEIALHVVAALHGSRDCPYKVDERVQWFLELIGQFRNVISSLSPDALTVAESCLTVVSGAALCWSDVSLASSLGLVRVVTVDQSRSSAGHVEHDKLFNYVLHLLPHALSSLLHEESWTNLASKILQWLLMVRKSPVCQAHSNLYNLVQDALLSLRDLTSYKDVAVWTEAAANLKHKT